MEFTIRPAIGGFIVSSVDEVEEEEEECVFTSVDGALGYLRAELVGLPDSPEEGAPDADPGTPQP